MKTIDAIQRPGRRGGWMLALLLAVACDPGPTAPPPPERVPVATVGVSPDTASLQVGSSRQLQASPRAADGRVLSDRAVQWASSDTTIAAVDGTGRVTARRAGVATITATSEGRRGSARIRIAAPPPPVAVESVVVSPGELVLEPGETAQLRVALYAADGTELTGRTVAWTSNHDEVVSVGATGTVHARGAGQAWITATSEGRSASARVMVSAWAERPLRSLDGVALPAVWQSLRVLDENDVEVTRTIRVVAGRLRANLGTQVYEQRLTMERWESTYVIVNGVPVFTGVQLKETRVFDDRGSVAPIHSGTGALVFRSEVREGHSFTGSRTGEGDFMVTQRINAWGDPVLLRFAP